MSKSIVIKNKIGKYNKTIRVQGDKSISIRFVLLASQAIGISRVYNLLESEDVKSSIHAVKKLGVKISKKKNYYEIIGCGLNGFNFTNNLKINAGNSGTLARLILGLLVKSYKKIKILGDKSLSRRDFGRVADPLKTCGVNLKTKNNCLPLSIKGSEFLRPINYFEKLGSAQVKSCLMIAALNIPGLTKIKAKKSRNHTEIFFKKVLKIPIKINSKCERFVVCFLQWSDIRHSTYILVPALVCTYPPETQKDRKLEWVYVDDLPPILSTTSPVLKR